MKEFFKQSKGLISFLVVAVASLFWITQPGLDLLHAGFTWLPYVQAPVLAAFFAFVNFGKPGKGLVKSDDQGHTLLGGFWAVFILLTIVLLAAAHWGFVGEM